MTPSTCGNVFQVGTEESSSRHSCNQSLEVKSTELPSRFTEFVLLIALNNTSSWFVFVFLSFDGIPLAYLSPFFLVNIKTFFITFN